MAWIDAAFQVGHGWPAIAGIVLLLVLWFLLCGVAIDAIEDWRAGAQS